MGGKGRKLYLNNNKKMFKKKILFIFYTEEKGGRKRGRDTSMCGFSRVPPIGNLSHNPGMYPDWESNQWPFGLQAGTQSTEPHQRGPLCTFING